ncbi:hypothetical protein LTR53_017272 [Teratosphaeriaceae sp. CCFEE 6253]|nr:hypothetical protein LTR53_017272 [Teratosphaeriaceae sp. CCFEE 6253]
MPAATTYFTSLLAEIEKRPKQRVLPSSLRAKKRSQGDELQCPERPRCEAPRDPIPRDPTPRDPTPRYRPQSQRPRPYGPQGCEPQACASPKHPREPPRYAPPWYGPPRYQPQTCDPPPDDSQPYEPQPYKPPKYNPQGVEPPRCDLQQFEPPLYEPRDLPPPKPEPPRSHPHSAESHHYEPQPCQGNHRRSPPYEHNSAPTPDIRTHVNTTPSNALERTLDLELAGLASRSLRIRASSSSSSKPSTYSHSPRFEPRDKYRISSAAHAALLHNKLAFLISNRERLTAEYGEAWATREEARRQLEEHPRARPRNRSDAVAARWFRRSGALRAALETAEAGVWWIGWEAGELRLRPFEYGGGCAIHLRWHESAGSFFFQPSSPKEPSRAAVIQHLHTTQPGVESTGTMARTSSHGAGVKPAIISDLARQGDRTPPTYAHGPRLNYQHGPLMPYAAHAALLHEKLAAVVTETKRLGAAYREACVVRDGAEKRLRRHDEVHSRWCVKGERAMWEYAEAVLLEEFRWAEEEIQRVEGEAAGLRLWRLQD